MRGQICYAKLSLAAWNIFKLAQIFNKRTSMYEWSEESPEVCTEFRVPDSLRGWALNITHLCKYGILGMCWLILQTLACMSQAKVIHFHTRPCASVSLKHLSYVGLPGLWNLFSHLGPKAGKHPGLMASKLTAPGFPQVSYPSTNQAKSRLASWDRACPWLHNINSFLCINTTEPIILNRTSAD